MPRNQHVVPYSGGWAVRGERNMRVTSVHRTQREAVAAARATARRYGGELFVHSLSGRIRWRDTTRGNDPMPPKR